MSLGASEASACVRVFTCSQESDSLLITGPDAVQANVEFANKKEKIVSDSKEFFITGARNGPSLTCA